MKFPSVFPSSGESLYPNTALLQRVSNQQQKDILVSTPQLTATWLCEVEQNVTHQPFAASSIVADENKNNSNNNRFINQQIIKYDDEYIYWNHVDVDKLKQVDCALTVQKWWRGVTIRKRYLCQRQITRPWERILQPGESVVYGSICLKHPSLGSTGLFHRNLGGGGTTKRVFLLLTTRQRLYCCDPSSKKTLDMWQLKHGETSCCDLGNNQFSVSSSPNSKGCFFTIKFTDLTSASFNWINSLRELPKTIDLSFTNRKNSFKASNFQVLIMGDLIQHQLNGSFNLKNALGWTRPCFVALHGCRLVIFRGKGSQMDLIDLDQFTSIQRVDSTHFSLQTGDGEVTLWECKSVREKESWMEHIQTIIQMATKCARRQHRGY